MEKDQPLFSIRIEIKIFTSFFNDGKMNFFSRKSWTCELVSVF